MLLDLDKFYNSNYKDFVHKEALEEALKFVPEAFLKDVETKAILSITFSVDDVGENPIYVTYLDNDNKEHIVKLRPNITDQLSEVLKRYPTKTEMQEALKELKTTVTNEYTIFVNSEVEALNNTINNINNSLTQSIKETLGEAKNYTDAKHEEALAKIAEGDTNTLNAATEYTDSLKDELTPVITANKNRLYMTNVDGIKNEIEKTGHVTFEVNDGIKAIEVKENNAETTPVKRVDFSTFARNADVTPLSSKLDNVWGGHKAPFIYWLPNIDVNTMKLENTENDVKVTINDGDVVYWRKNEYQPVDLTEYAKKNELTTIKEYNNGTKKVNNLIIRTSGQYSVEQGANNSLGFVLNGRERYATVLSYNTNSNDYVVNHLQINEKITNNNIPYYPATVFNLSTIDELALLPASSILNIATTSNTYSKSEVEAVAQEQNAMNSENVPVSLQQKTRAVQNISNNSTLVETKDFYILNLDFSFVPNQLPSSVESEINTSLNIDAPLFTGRKYTITYVAGEHKTETECKIGSHIAIKVPAVPVDETLSNIKVVVKDKIIIRKETE